MKTVLTIAGSDPFGGAGLQADLKTFTAHDVYGMTVITLLSAQNSIGFYEASVTSVDLLEKQIDAIFEDVRPDAIKTGMLLSSEIIKLVADKLKQYKPNNLLIDPVMIAHRSIILIKEDAQKTMINELIPLADIITPNLGEAEIISGMKIKNKEDMIKATKKIFDRFGCVVFTKGGISKDDADDLLYTKDGYKWIKGDLIDTKNTRGTGCSLSAAIISNLAKGKSIEESVTQAKRFVTKGLESNIQIGNGRGPIQHSFDIEGEY